MLIGQIVGAFGVHGEAKVEALTDFPERFTTLARVYLGPELKEYSVHHARRGKAHMLLKLGGVDTPESVDRLRGLEVHIPRSEAMPLPEGHYYLYDVIGMYVTTPDGS